MNKTLLLIMQSVNVEMYLNCLAHCAWLEGIEDVYFVGGEVLAEKQNELIINASKIIDNLRCPKDNNSAIRRAAQLFPENRDLQNRSFRIDFIHPHLSIENIKAKFPDEDKLIIDITGTSRQLGINLAATCLLNRVGHVCTFILSDEVYSPSWKSIPHEKGNYYYSYLVDQNNRPLFYTYLDFSVSESFRHSLKTLSVKDASTLKNRGELLWDISNSFTLSEIRTLCFEMKIDYEHLSGEDDKLSKIRELILFCERRNITSKLLEICNKERTNISW